MLSVFKIKCCGKVSHHDVTNLHFFVSNIGQMWSISSLGWVLRIDVEILEEDGLGEGGLVVDPWASLTVCAGSDLEEEGTIDLVLLCTKYTGKILCHVSVWNCLKCFKTVEMTELTRILSTRYEWHGYMRHGAHHWTVAESRISITLHVYL